MQYKYFCFFVLVEILELFLENVFVVLVVFGKSIFNFVSNVFIFWSKANRK
jgi:hypothetical protein